MAEGTSTSMVSKGCWCLRCIKRQWTDSHKSTSAAAWRPINTIHSGDPIIAGQEEMPQTMEAMSNAQSTLACARKRRAASVGKEVEATASAATEEVTHL